MRPVVRLPGMKLHETSARLWPHRQLALPIVLAYTTDQLITINTSNGQGTAVGPVGFGSIEGLGFDTQTGKLYGTNTGTFGDGALIEIDTLTGAGTVVLERAGYWMLGLAGTR